MGQLNIMEIFKMKNYGLIKSYLLKLYNAYGKKADVVNAPA